MRKPIFLLLFCFFCIQLHSQDIITLTNADEISAKVEEITETEIVYKKSSNPKGPSYRVNRGKVFSIKYANGEKEVFTSIDSQGTKNANSGVDNQKHGQADDAEANANALNQFSRTNDIHFIGKRENKKAKKLIGIFYPTNDSKISDANVELSFRMVAYSSRDNKVSERQSQASSMLMKSSSQRSVNNYVIRITNKTDQIIYIDKANCFHIANGISTPYYVPQKTSDHEGSSTGMGIDLGAVTGGLLGGMSMGGSNSSGTTVTTFSQRIVSIPPQMSIDLAPVSLIPVIKIGDGTLNYFGLSISSSAWDGQTKFDYSTMEELSVGEERELPPSNEYGFGTFVTYGFDEQMSTSYNLNANFMMKRVIGYKKGSKDLSGQYYTSFSLLLE